MDQILATRAAQKLNPGQSFISPELILMFIELFGVILDGCKEKNGANFTMEKFKDNATTPSRRHKIWARRQARRELGLRGRENREAVDASIAAIEETSLEELNEFDAENENAGLLT